MFAFWGLDRFCSRGNRLLSRVPPSLPLPAIQRQTPRNTQGRPSGPPEPTVSSPVPLRHRPSSSTSSQAPSSRGQAATWIWPRLPLGLRRGLAVAELGRDDGATAARLSRPPPALGLSVGGRVLLPDRAVGRIPVIKVSCCCSSGNQAARRDSRAPDLLLEGAGGQWSVTLAASWRTAAQGHCSPRGVLAAYVWLLH